MSTKNKVKRLLIEATKTGAVEWHRKTASGMYSSGSWFQAYIGRVNLYKFSALRVSGSINEGRTVTLWNSPRLALAISKAHKNKVESAQDSRRDAVLAELERALMQMGETNGH